MKQWKAKIFIRPPPGQSKAPGTTIQKEDPKNTGHYTPQGCSSSPVYLLVSKRFSYPEKMKGRKTDEN